MESRATAVISLYNSWLSTSVKGAELDEQLCICFYIKKQEWFDLLQTHKQYTFLTSVG